MAKNYGILGGSAMRGYYDGRNMRMDAEDRDRDRKEHKEDRVIDLETAMLRLKDARRTGELNQYIQNKGYGRKAADEASETSTLNLGTARRGDAESAARHPGVMKRIPQEDKTSQDTYALGQKQHPINMQTTEFVGKQQTDTMADYDQGRKFWDDYQNVQNALASFDMTGNPKIIMDAYDLYIDDGIDAVIQKLPGLKESDGPRYQVTTNNGQPPALFESKEHLLKATERIFMDHMQRTQPMSGGQGAYGIGMDAFGNSSQDMGKPPADVKTAEYLVQAMKGIEKYKGLSPEQMRMEAFRLANAKVDDTPESDIRQFFVKTFMQQMKGPAGGLGPPPDPAEAWEIATQMTEQYRYERHGIGKKPKLKTGGDGDGNSALEDWVKSKAGVS